MMRLSTLAPVLAGCFFGAVHAECHRDKLLATADAYIAAQAAGKPSDIQKLLSTSNYTYMENNKAADFKGGLISNSLKLDNNRNQAETTTNATKTEHNKTGPTPYV